MISERQGITPLRKFSEAADVKRVKVNDPNVESCPLRHPRNDRWTERRIRVRRRGRRYHQHSVARPARRHRTVQASHVRLQR